MDNSARIAVLTEAMDHQYDEDENADLAVDSDDPVIQAAVTLINHYGSWAEIVIEPHDLVEALSLLFGVDTQGKTS